MFYSPKKDIQRYVTLKNHEIKSIRQELQSEKVSEENIEAARKKLDKLKNQYNILVSQDYGELIKTLQKTQQKSLLVKEQVKLKQKELKLKNAEKSETSQMKKQLLEKINRAKERIGCKKIAKEKLLQTRQQVDQKVLNLVNTNQKLRLQNDESNTLQIKAKQQLTQSIRRATKNQEKQKVLKQKMNQIGVQILSQKDSLNQMKARNNVQEMKIENLELKFQNLLQVKSTLLEQKQKHQMQKLMAKERSELNRHQIVSSEIMKTLVKLTESMKQNKEKEKENCEREVKEKLIEVEVIQCVNTELQNSVKSTRQKIEKTQKQLFQITDKLNNVSVKDNDLISMIMGKYTSQNQITNIPLKIIDQNKQNSIDYEIKFKESGWAKLNSFQLAKTSPEQNDVEC